mmetsp:Transcript_11872/g.22624  ORF Transcript_11872/g.22624 Transcript_11872/m.22624 type:complete len:253 (+) Transcript_11872:1217-1975(+)
MSHHSCAEEVVDHQAGGVVLAQDRLASQLQVVLRHAQLPHVVLCGRVLVLGLVQLVLVVGHRFGELLVLELDEIHLLRQSCNRLLLLLDLLLAVLGAIRDFLLQLCYLAAQLFGLGLLCVQLVLDRLNLLLLARLLHNQVVVAGVGLASVCRLLAPFLGQLFHLLLGLLQGCSAAGQLLFELFYLSGLLLGCACAWFLTAGVRRCGRGDCDARGLALLLVVCSPSSWQIGALDHDTRQVRIVPLQSQTHRAE